jgi:hypothetical protein
MKIFDFLKNLDESKNNFIELDVSESDKVVCKLTKKRNK